MRLLTDYSFGDSFVHRLDPRTKLWWLCSLGLVALTAASSRQLLVLLAMILLASVMAGLKVKEYLPMLQIIALVGGHILLLQAFLHPGGRVLFALGSARFYAEGLGFGLVGLLRLTCLVLLFLQFLMWTHPTDISLLLVKWRVPYRYAILLGLALRFLPIMEKEFRAIFDCQRARGLALDGVWQKARGLLPVTQTLLLRAFRRTEEVALSMELKGFGCNKHRTFLRTLELSVNDYLLCIVITLVTLALLWLGTVN